MESLFKMLDHHFIDDEQQHHEYSISVFEIKMIDETDMDVDEDGIYFGISGRPIHFEDEETSLKKGFIKKYESLPEEEIGVYLNYHLMRYKGNYLDWLERIGILLKFFKEYGNYYFQVGILNEELHKTKLTEKNQIALSWIESVKSIYEKEGGELIKNGLTIYQQFLLFHFLGIDELLKYQTSDRKKAEIYATLMRRDHEDFRKRVLRVGLKHLMTEKNLKKVYEFLDKYEFPTSEVEKCMLKLKH